MFTSIAIELTAKIIGNSFANIADENDALTKDLSIIVAEINDDDNAQQLDADIKQRFSGNEESLSLWEQIKELSQTAEKKDFGPVLSDSPTAEGRLALLNIILARTNSSLLKSQVKSFVEDSNSGTEGNIFRLFSIAINVSEIFDQLIDLDTTRDRWEREIVPRLLQLSLKNSDLLLRFTVAATGGLLDRDQDLTQWEKVESWLKGWDEARTKSPANQSETDGFFTPFEPNYQPAALHPLSLRILRDSILSESSDVINAFSQWITDSVFDLEQRIINILPESAFAAGAFLLALIRQNRLENPSLVQDKVISTIALNSEKSAITPELWQGRRERIYELVNNCPDFYESTTLGLLRQNAASRFNPEFESLKRTIVEQNREIPSDFLPSAELDAEDVLVDIRPQSSIFDAISIDISPDTPINPAEGNFGQFQDPQWRDYLETLSNTETNLVNAENNERKIRAISERTRRQILKVEELLESPLTETAFNNSVFGMISEDSALSTLFRNSSRKVFLENRIQVDGELKIESLGNQQPWIETVNKTAVNSTVFLQEWAKLETWDSLRGRLSKTDIQSEIIKRTVPPLIKKLKAPLENIDISVFRPQIAAACLLGIQSKSEFSIQLVSEIETLLANSDSLLSDELKSLFCAARLELALTDISAGVTPANAIDKLADDTEALRVFADWISTALNSDNTWESRAGMNMLILAARLSLETNDPWVETIFETAIRNAPNVTLWVNKSLNALLSTTTDRALSGLALSLVAFDLLKYAKSKLISITTDFVNKKPIWLSGVEPFAKIDEITSRLSEVGDGGRVFSSFASEGGLAAKVLVLSITQIKLDELDLQRQLLVKPVIGDEQGEILLEQLFALKKSLRALFCRDEVLLKGLPNLAENSEILPWWQAQYWSGLSAQNSTISNAESFSQLNAGFAQELDSNRLSDNLREILNLSQDAIARVQQRDSEWLILDKEQIISVKRIGDVGTDLSVSQVTRPFNLFNWSESFNNDTATNLLASAATIDALVSPSLRNEEKDIDGKFENEFPDFSWKQSYESFVSRIERLKRSEEEYAEVIKEELADGKNDDIVRLLQQPLALATADYREQIQIAVADLRVAEADLEVAEREALAAEFETFANSLLYEASELEVQRRGILEEIRALDEQIAEFDTLNADIERQRGENEITVQEANVRIAQNSYEQVKIQKRKAERARAAIEGEIKLIKKVLGTNEADSEFESVQVTVKLSDGSEEKANGQIAAFGIQIEDSLLSQLREDLVDAEISLQREIEKEKERKKKAKRRRWIKAACSFVGAVVGGVLGGPAGAALGAQIGEAVAEIANGVIDNKPPGQILIGLVDNAFSIAQAAGVNLELELNTLGAKAAAEISQFLTTVESNFGPILNSLPNILDDELFKDAIEVLDLEEVPQLADLLKKSYGDLKSDSQNLGNLGTELTQLFTEGGNKGAVGFDSPEELLDKLTDRLFENTKNNVKQIEGLAKSVGEEIEDIATNPSTQLEIAKSAAEKAGKLVFAQLSQQASQYQRQIVTEWIHQKRDLNLTWDLVREEGEKLVQELFRDSEVRKDVLSNLETSLLDPKVLQAQTQILLQPWQAELDKRLKEITEFDTGSAPGSAVEAAKQRVDYLKGAINNFEEKLIPWLKGEDNLQRADLFRQLNEKIKEQADAADDVEILDLSEQSFEISIAQSETILINARKSLEIINNLYEISQIRENQASLRSKVANIAKSQSEKLRDAQANTLKAAEQKFKAAQAKIKSAQFTIESRQFGVEAAIVRGSEASRIRGSLSLPPLRLPNQSQSKLIQAQLTHATDLERAFREYRELIRYIVSAGVSSENIPQLTLPFLREQDTTWSEILENYRTNEIKDVFISGNFNAPTLSTDKIQWELTPQQIQSLFTSGFNMKVIPRGLISFESILFQLPSTDQILLDQIGRLSDPSISEEQRKEIETIYDRISFDSFSRRVFNKTGEELSKTIEVDIEVPNLRWKVTDKETVPVVIKASDSNLFAIDSESKSFTVNRDPSNGRLTVIQRFRNEAIGGRSPLNEEKVLLQVDEKTARTGRIAGFFLSGRKQDSGSDLESETSEYEITVEHQGDYYLADSENKFSAQLGRVKELNDDRDFFVSESRTGVEDLEERLTKFRDFVASQGDPEPFRVTGIPLSGTSIIRLKSQVGAPAFDKLTIHILYSSFN